MDAPVEVLMTENIRHFIRTVLLTSDLPNDTRDELRKYGGGTRRSNASMNSDDGRRPRTIPFQLLRSVHDMQLVKGDTVMSLFIEHHYYRLPVTSSQGHLVTGQLVTHTPHHTVNSSQAST